MEAKETFCANIKKKRAHICIFMCILTSGKIVSPKLLQETRRTLHTDKRAINQQDIWIINT